jgi:hypothetical protein
MTGLLGATTTGCKAGNRKRVCDGKYCDVTVVPAALKGRPLRQQGLHRTDSLANVGTCTPIPGAPQVRTPICDHCQPSDTVTRATVARPRNRSIQSPTRQPNQMCAQRSSAAKPKGTRAERNAASDCTTVRGRRQAKWREGMRNSGDTIRGGR